MAHVAFKDTFIVVRLDIRNAFNEICRAAVVASFLEEPKLEHMAPFVAQILRGKFTISLEGEIWVEIDGEMRSLEGVIQGCPLAMAMFAVALQPHLRWADLQLQQYGGVARAGADDIYLVGPAEQTLALAEEFAARMRAWPLGHPGGL